MEIAYRLNRILSEYDPYGYYDAYGCFVDSEAGIREAENLLTYPVGRETIIANLSDIIEETEDDELIEEAQTLINILRRGA